MDMKLQRPPKSPCKGDFKPPDLPRTVGVVHPLLIRRENGKLILSPDKEKGSLSG